MSAGTQNVAELPTARQIHEMINQRTRGAIDQLLVDVDCGTVTLGGITNFLVSQATGPAGRSGDAGSRDARQSNRSRLIDDTSAQSETTLNRLRSVECFVAVASSRRPDHAIGGLKAALRCYRHDAQASGFRTLFSFTRLRVVLVFRAKQALTALDATAT